MARFNPAKSAKAFGKAAKAAEPLASPPNEPFRKERLSGLDGVTEFLQNSLRGSKVFTRDEMKRGYRKL